MFVHLKWLIWALNGHQKNNETVDTDMTIGEFIKNNCEELLNQSGINLTD